MTRQTIRRVNDCRIIVQNVTSDLVVLAIDDRDRPKILLNYANNMCSPWSQPERTFWKGCWLRLLIEREDVSYFFLTMIRSGVPVKP